MADPTGSATTWQWDANGLRIDRNGDPVPAPNEPRFTGSTPADVLQQTATGSAYYGLYTADSVLGQLSSLNINDTGSGEAEPSSFGASHGQTQTISQQYGQTQQPHQQSQSYQTTPDYQTNTQQYIQPGYAPTYNQYASQAPNVARPSASYAQQSRDSGWPRGTRGQINPEFYIRRKKTERKEFFKPGRVLKVYWPEPAGMSARTTMDSTDTTILTSENGEQVFLKIRWFVVLASAGETASYCLSIQTYRDQGVAKPDVVKCHHSIVHVGRVAPSPGSDEEPNTLVGELGMLAPIRVVPTKESYRMHPKARINFAKPYTVEHNLRVYDFGMVHRNFLQPLRAQYDWVRSYLDALDTQNHGQGNNDEDDDSEDDDEPTSGDGGTKTPKARVPDASQRRGSSSRDQERPRKEDDKSKKGYPSQEHSQRRRRT